MGRKSALGNIIAQTVLPPIQQAQQQSTMAIMQAIQSIPQPQGLDPMLLQQIEQAIAAVGQVDIMPVVGAIQNMSEQLNALSMADERPTHWTMTMERDPMTHFLKRVHVSPMLEAPNMETSDVETEVFSA